MMPYLSAWNPSSHPIDLTYNEYPRGANLALRRSVFGRYGSFHPRLGRRGRRLLSCEETELCLRIERGGGRIVFVPGAAVDHAVGTARLTRSWLERRFFSQGESEALLEWRHGGFSALRHGRRRHDRLATLARDDRLLQQCHRAARRGYRRGSWLAPWLMARYRRDRTGTVAGPWKQLPIP